MVDVTFTSGFNKWDELEQDLADASIAEEAPLHNLRRSALGFQPAHAGPIGWRRVFTADEQAGAPSRIASETGWCTLPSNGTVPLGTNADLPVNFGLTTAALHNSEHVDAEHFHHEDVERPNAPASGDPLHRSCEAASETAQTDQPASCPAEPMSMAQDELASLQLAQQLQEESDAEFARRLEQTLQDSDKAAAAEQTAAQAAEQVAAHASNDAFESSSNRQRPRVFIHRDVASEATVPCRRMIFRPLLGPGNHQEVIPNEWSVNSGVQQGTNEADSTAQPAHRWRPAGQAYGVGGLRRPPVFRQHEVRRPDEPSAEPNYFAQENSSEPWRDSSSSSRSSSASRHSEPQLPWRHVTRPHGSAAPSRTQGSSDSAHAAPRPTPAPSISQGTPNSVHRAPRPADAPSQVRAAVRNQNRHAQTIRSSRGRADLEGRTVVAPFQMPPPGADGALLECAICMEAFEEGVQVRTLPCLHKYHLPCIDQWLRGNGLCPICKHPVRRSQ